MNIDLVQEPNEPNEPNQDVPLEPFVFVKKNLNHLNNLNNLNNLNMNNKLMPIPSFHEYEWMNQKKYTIPQLKTILKNYGLKTSGGNKQFLIDKITNHLRFSVFALKIQTQMRRYWVKKYIHSHGPALKMKNRTKCVNDIDFLTMDNLTDISCVQFFSYTDEEQFTYGFDIVSLYNLIYINKFDKNPFNQKPFPKEVFIELSNVLKLGRLLKIKVNVLVEDVHQHLNTKKSFELRVLSLFQSINAMGYYADPQWFLNLSKIQIIQMLFELKDIWDYRAGLTIETKENICPRLSFRYLKNNITPTSTLEKIQLLAVDIMEKMVYSGSNNDNKLLGSLYVLGSLTLVSMEASTNMYWLYQSMTHV